MQNDINMQLTPRSEVLSLPFVINTKATSDFLWTEWMLEILHCHIHVDAGVYIYFIPESRVNKATKANTTTIYKMQYNTRTRVQFY